MLDLPERLESEKSPLIQPDLRSGEQLQRWAQTKFEPSQTAEPPNRLDTKLDRVAASISAHHPSLATEG